VASNQARVVPRSEGIKPISKGGSLTFEPRLGFFLEWVAGLKDYSAKTRHVLLVLDEINRCDTAAVLGELLQLLEYRGTTVRLLSGRNVVFPNNLFIIGTMNRGGGGVGASGTNRPEAPYCVVR
jgi:MoxR-like ATPase